MNIFEFTELGFWWTLEQKLLIQCAVACHADSEFIISPICFRNTIQEPPVYQHSLALYTGNGEPSLNCELLVPWHLLSSEQAYVTCYPLHVLRLPHTPIQ